MSRSIWVGPIFLSLAMLGFIGWNVVRTTDFRSLAPLPAPGYAVRLEAEPFKAGPYRLSVKLPATRVEQERVSDETAAPLSCNIIVSEVGNHPGEITRSILHAYGTIGNMNLILYGSSRFTLTIGYHSFEVRNDGCKAGYAFPGGLASIDYAGPVQLNWTYTLLWVMPYAFGLLGLSAFLSTLITGMRKRRQKGG